MYSLLVNLFYCHNDLTQIHIQCIISLIDSAHTHTHKELTQEKTPYKEQT